MQVSDLPESRLLGVAIDEDGLAQLLVRAMRGYPAIFYHHGGMAGLSMSVWVLLQYERFDSVPLPEPMSARAVAEEFFSAKFMTQARYNPLGPPQFGYRKGWGVRVYEFDSRPVVILWAAWVQDL